MASYLRQLVSGKKDRFQQDGYDLDLVLLTERIVIMGYPASGIEGIYRNKRSEILRWLHDKSPQGKYRIFSLCPRCENFYPPSAFEGRVYRFPFPDHFPPPLALFALFTARFASWLNQDPENIALIHCKAGKGRSGSMAISYLLTQPGLPRPPPMDEPRDEDKPRMTSKHAPSEEEALAMSATERLPFLINYHSSRRMAPSSSGNTRTGVSIASQRRFLRYYAEILDGKDPRVPADQRPRFVALKSVRIIGSGLKGVAKSLMGSNVALRVSRYKDTIIEKLDKRESALRLDPLAEEQWNDDDWDDKDMMIVTSGEMRQHEHINDDHLGELDPSHVDTDGSEDEAHTITTARGSQEHFEKTSPLVDSSSRHERVLLPAKSFLPADQQLKSALSSSEAGAEAKRRGIVVGADREVSLRFLIGKTGSKHSSLPVMTSLALVWFIPSFEDKSGMLVVPAKEMDFLKPASGIERVEIEWQTIQ